jgi:hypothetical protein
MPNGSIQVWDDLSNAIGKSDAVSSSQRAGTSCANAAQLQTKNSKENKKVFISKAVLVYLVKI